MKHFFSVKTRLYLNLNFHFAFTPKMKSLFSSHRTASCSIPDRLLVLRRMLKKWFCWNNAVHIIYELWFHQVPLQFLPYVVQVLLNFFQETFQFHSPGVKDKEHLTRGVYRHQSSSYLFWSARIITGDMLHDQRARPETGARLRGAQTDAASDKHHEANVLTWAHGKKCAFHSPHADLGVANCWVASADTLLPIARKEGLI